MTETYSQSLVVGIDAGGTRIRACLAPAAPGGAPLGHGTGGPGNPLSVGRADLTRHLGAALAGAVPPGQRAAVAAVHGGFAGAAPGLGPERGEELALSCLKDALAAGGFSPAAVAIGGDTDIALAAAPGAPADGLVLVAGTGAIAARLAGRRRELVVDGHGWLLGDEGSGFWLGDRAVRAALEALDGRGPWTALVDAVAAHYLSAPEYRAPADRLGPVQRHLLAESIVSAAYDRAPALLALLSPVAFAAADTGDAVAGRLLDRAADLLVGSVRALGPRPGEPLVVTGGLLGPGGPLLDRVADRLDGLGLRLFPVPDGGAGAAALARLLLE